MMLSLVAVLFLACHFAFETGATPVPAGWVDLMFMVSVVSSLALTGGFSFLFRMEIDHAEDQLIEINLNLEKLSTTDQLTSLPNRRSLDHFLEREWARMAREKRPLSILMCDVDYFKAYNDHYGHQAGDECLRRIAIALEEEVGRPPDLVARYGGEEFAVILPHTNEAGARYLGERVRLAIERLGITHACSEVSGVITLSVGTSTFMPDSDVLAQQLLARADEALYEAKSGGRNHVVFQPLG